MTNTHYGLFCHEQLSEHKSCSIPLLLCVSDNKERIQNLMLKLETLNHWIGVEDQKNLRKKIPESLIDILARSNYKLREAVKFYPLGSSGTELHLVPVIGTSYFYLKEVPII